MDADELASRRALATIRTDGQQKLSIQSTHGSDDSRIGTQPSHFGINNHREMVLDK